MKVLKTLFQTRAVMTLLLCLLTTMTAWAKDVSTYYIDADGTRHDVTATVLTGGGSTTLKGTYVVNSDISYTGKITLNGNVNIILMDGKKMTVSNTGTGDKDYAIYGDKKELHIYGQRLGTGELEVTGDGGSSNGAIYIEGVLGIHGGVVTVEKTNCSTAYAIEVDSYKNNNEVVGGIAITGGRVTVTGDAGGIICYDGYIRILGGQVTATGNSYYGLAISNSSYAFFYDDRLTGSLILGSTNPTDFIHFNKILYSGYDPHYDDNCDKVKIADGQTLYDGTGASYNDQTTWETLAALTNVTLRNYDYRTVTFDSNGGSAVDAQTVALGGKATEPDAPTRDGCTFAGWTLNGADYDFDNAVNDNITLVAKWSVTTYYVDADGTTHDNITATLLTGGGSTTLAEGTYVVNSDITYTGMITLGGDVNIILGDGKTMTVTNTGAHYDDNAIYGESKALHIYGQSQGTGALTATVVEGSYTICIKKTENGAGSLLGIHGGVLTVNKNILVAGDHVSGTGGIIISDGRVTISGVIGCDGGNFDIRGGQVTVNGLVGILNANLTLGCSKNTDFISFNNIDNIYRSLDEAGEVKIASGQTLYDGIGASYNDQTASATLEELTNVTLRNYDYRTVTFDSNGGSAVAAQILTPGDKATEPTAPTREGCTFDGWKLNGADYDFDSYVNSPITLVAQWSATTTYVDENGTPTDNVSAIALGGSETTLSAGTYLVNSDITYDHTLKLGDGTVNIILADGKTMNINVELENCGITKDDGDGVSPDLHIYGQTTDTNDAGSMEVNSTNGIININSFTQHSGNVKSVATAEDVSVYAFNVSNFTLNGGKLTVSAIWENANGIYANDNVTINGGVLNATSNNSSHYYGEAIIFGNSGVIINGGQVSVTAENGGVGIKSSEGDITLGYSSADDFVQVSRYNVSSGKKVKIKDGLKMTDDTNTYDDQTESAALAALTNTTLRPVTYTITFDIDDYDDDPASQTVAHGLMATAPASNRTGYHVNEWKLGEDDYDFSASVTSDLYLTASWTPITYTVQFDNNGGSGTMSSVTATFDQWTSIPACTFIAPEGYALKEYGWNTEADGSGDSFYAENGDFYNLANEQGAVVTLYAQWAKDIKLCTAEEVPDQTLNGYDYIYYKFDAANYGYAATGVKITDGNKVLTLGTDYKFKNVIYKNARQDDETMPHELGDECTLIIQGIGEYVGTLTADFKIVSPEDNGTWGDLVWSINSNGEFTISLKDGVTGPVAMQETTQGNYDWYSKANSIRTITIGEGITSVAANAFAGTANVNNYGNVYLLTLPSTLTTIGENAFAYCTGLSIDLADLDGIDYPVNAFSYIKSITGTLYDNADNSKTIAIMSLAGSNTVTIKGRTLYKDGNWNTICLPFDVKADNSLLDDATVKELDVKGYYDKDGAYQSYQNDNFTRTGFDNGTLYLYFKDATADSDDNLLKAGIPYLIKWDSGENITGDLTFEGVKLIPSPQNIQSADEKVNFFGTYSPVSLAKDDKSNLFLGDDNMLYYPNVADYSIKAFRGYFHVDLTDGDGVRAINLNFGEEGTQTIIGHTEITEITEKADASWYTIDGIRLNSKPSKKGLYIHNGRKTVVK